MILIVATMKLKTTTCTATWNVRTVLQKGKLENIKQEIKGLHLMLGISKVRWQDAGKNNIRNVRDILLRGTEHERGVT